MQRKIRMGMVGGGQGAFIGPIHLMAAQLDKRARQLAQQKGCPYEEALAHLLYLMKEGWASQQKS